MAHSPNTFNAERPTGSPLLRTPRLVRELGLIVGLVVLIFVALALLSYSASDAAWSTSGAGGGAHNLGGVLGAWVADLLYWGFGFSAWWLLIFGAWAWGRAVWLWVRTGSVRGGKPVSTQAHRSRVLRQVSWWLGLALVLAASTGLEWSRLYRWDDLLPGPAGGLLGFLGGPLAEKWLGFTGSGLLGIAALLAGVGLAFRLSWGRLAEWIGAHLEGLFRSWHVHRERVDRAPAGSALPQEPRDDLPRERVPASAAPTTPVAPVMIEPVLAEVPQSPQVPMQQGNRVAHGMVTEDPKSPQVQKGRPPVLQDSLAGHLPQVTLLDPAPAATETVDPETLEMTSRLIEKKLGDFGVGVRVMAAAPGPVITRYEIEPATGVKGSQIVNLAKDLARSLSLVSIRVVETIPGKNFMALELPNARRQTIHLSEILGSKVYNDAKSLLTVGLGKDIVGKPVVANLAKMPHVLVAGTTGSGKSVGINAMILSLLYKADPKDVRLLLIDPKMLEMSVYEGIPHLVAPVVTDMRQAAHGLSWCITEMERRYKLMSKVGVRNLAGFNQKIAEARARGEDIPNPFSLTPDDPEPLEHLPHLVIVIDELADLMMVVGKKVEELIARLAQKARAAGIHLILATQRPSVDVITGLIKANIPTRISFHVSSKIDSRTILDQMGAEALLGMGDMLYLANGASVPTRVHGAFVSDDEVHRVVDYLKAHGEPNYIEGVLEGGTVDDGDDAGGEGGDPDGEADPMYDRAVEVVLKNHKASISLVQRHLRIGYNRAARLVESMESAGLVSSMTADGKREVLAPVHEE